MIEFAILKDETDHVPVLLSLFSAFKQIITCTGCYMLHTQITRLIKHKVVFIRKTPSTCFSLFFPDTLCGS